MRSSPGPVHSLAGPGPIIWVQVCQVQDQPLDSLKKTQRNGRAKSFETWTKTTSQRASEMMELRWMVHSEGKATIDRCPVALVTTAVVEKPEIIEEVIQVVVVIMEINTRSDKH